MHFLETLQNTGKIGAVAREQLAFVRGLKVSDSVWVQIVEPHVREHVEERPELRQTRSVDEVQAVFRRGRSNRYALGCNHLTLFDEVGGMTHDALFSLHSVVTVRARSHFEGEMSLRAIGEL
ncbi:hypothetical protein ACN28S_17165 [Cystobacter fuscus]